MLRMAGLPWRAARGRGVFLVVAVWVVTSIVGLVIVTVVSKPGHSPASSASGQAVGGHLGPQNSNHPLLVGRRTTVAGARAAVHYPVPLRDTSAASQANLTQVWVNSDMRDVGLVSREERLR